MNEPASELYRKLLDAKSGGADAIDLALGEFEAFYRAACRDGLGKAFFKEAETLINTVASDVELLTSAFLRWLPDSEFEDLSDKLCRVADGHHLQADAVPFDLACGEKRRVEAVALRLVSLATSPSLSVGWLLSLAKEHGAESDTAQLVEELMDFHVAEFPASMRQILMVQENPLVELEVARRALEFLNTRREFLESLPDARELEMPVPMWLMYSSLRYERSRAINAVSEEHSLFASLFKPRRFKYATRTAVEIHHGDQIHEQTLEMAPFSISYELPVTERANPLAAHVQRLEFRKRGMV